MASNQVMLLTSINKKHLRKVKLNRNRKLRRKRNKKFFLLKLKAKREARSADTLCEKLVDLFDYEQMDQAMEFHVNSKQPAGFTSTFQDVADWQHQHQVAYWKSKALALQMENQILNKHIKYLYDKQMQQYLFYKDSQWVEVAPDTRQDKNTSPTETSRRNHKMTDMDLVTEEMEEMSLPPKEQPGEARRKKLVEMYGDQAAKINGMETAIQLNFEHCMNKDKPPYWPNIPLKP